MGDGAKKSGAGGFLPGLVLGVIVGAATAFVALEVIDSPRIDVDPDRSEGIVDRADREAENLERGGRELIDQVGEAIEDAGDGLEDAADDAGALLDDVAEENKTTPPADPTDG